MDKASSDEEAAEAPSQEQPPKEKPQEEVEEKKEEDIKYFPGENLEASLDKVDEILGGTEPAKEESGKEPRELKPTLEDKEDSSFEVISDIPLAPKQELPVESGIEALSGEETEPVEEEIKEPEEKPEVSPEETEEVPKSDQRESPRDEVSEGNESEEEKESLEEVSYVLDRSPLEKGKIGLLECFCLFGGLAVLGFLAYLFLKG